ncbi:MAG: hypothetical protein RLZZ630_1374 [Bacteroidota bacterium]|jgi:NADH:ubiquinone oxidoreductase subunit 5 (subunit L)/multisubunit Na+/H+ antiporter MnhA subunit
MRLILILILFIPLLAWWTSLLLGNRAEKQIAYLASGAALLQLLAGIVALVLWLFNDAVDTGIHLLTVYQSPDFDFSVDFFYNSLTAVYLLLSAFLILIVSVFSRFYLHRESGYKRYYNHLLLFHTGLTFLILAGNFATLFFGWEIVGISSFLLIAFYRDRYLPVRNALKVLSFYRMGDVALLCAIWFFHHLAHGQFDFVSGNTESNTEALPLGFALLLILAASIKSAQFPFSTWLPRALEGPTTSSAIFYGSLSLHLGVFLLLRTSVLWFDVPGAGTTLIVIGTITALLSNWTAAVQPTTKTQIAYASITQIGLMFIGLGLGWHTLVLFHLVGHAVLRTYQLLISPSSMNYLSHHQFYYYDPSRISFWNRLPERVRDSLYFISVKEWGIDGFWYHRLWRPIKHLSRSLHFIRRPAWLGFFMALPFVVAAISLRVLDLDVSSLDLLFQSMGLLGLVFVLIAWSERRSAVRAWLFVTLSQVFFMTSIVQEHPLDVMQFVLYGGGILLAFIMGYFALHRLDRIENGIGLNEFHGHVYEHPGLATLFLVSALVMIGFPFSPTFLGFDILFSKIGFHHPLLVATGFLTFVFLELSVLRIYARVFLGLHAKSYHEVAFRSS